MNKKTTSISLGMPCMLKNHPTGDKYRLPPGYDMKTSVSALERAMHLSQELLEQSDAQGKQVVIHPLVEQQQELPLSQKAQEGTQATPLDEPSLNEPHQKAAAAGTMEPTASANIGPQDKVARWTPGALRHAAMQLVIADWSNLEIHVENAGDTPTEKLATFKKGMAKHGVTEVLAYLIQCI
jgi:hypothetical protein